MVIGAGSLLDLAGGTIRVGIPEGYGGKRAFEDKLGSFPAEKTLVTSAHAATDVAALSERAA